MSKRLPTALSQPVRLSDRLGSDGHLRDSDRGLGLLIIRAIVGHVEGAPVLPHILLVPPRICKHNIVTGQ